MKKLLGSSTYALPAAVGALVVCAALLAALAIKRPRSSAAPRSCAISGNLLAVAEALTSIVSGVMLWIGVWDLLDEYIIPEVWWAKLCLIVLGGVALYASRALYDGQEEAGNTSQRAPPKTPLKQPSNSSLCWPAVVDLETPLPTMTPPETPRLSRDQNEIESFTLTSAVGAPPTAWPLRRRSSSILKVEYFDRPTFSGAKCSRALSAIIAGLVLWVGTWVRRHYPPPRLKLIILLHSRSHTSTLPIAGSDRLSYRAQLVSSVQESFGGVRGNQVLPFFAGRDRFILHSFVVRRCDAS